MGSSSNGSTMDLVLGYNGVGRILGQGAVSGGRASAPRGGIFGTQAGLARMFGSAWGGQISWLLPLSLLMVAAVAVGGILHWRAKLPARHAWRAGWILWGGWLLVVGVLLSVGQGIAHSYYSVLIAPPIAAVCAAGVVRQSRFLLSAGVAFTAIWAWVLISRDTAWNGWLRYAVAA